MRYDENMIGRFWAKHDTRRSFILDERKVEVKRWEVGEQNYIKMI